MANVLTVANFLAIGLGAAVGAWCRWGLGMWLNPGVGRFPYGTLAANFVGSYIIGLTIAWTLLNPEWPSHYRLFLVTGLLGALTTFSTFSAETVTFLHEGRVSLAVIYSVVTLLGCLAMTALGWVSLNFLRS
jgi:fluoride exporter